MASYVFRLTGLSIIFPAKDRQRWHLRQQIQEDQPCFQLLVYQTLLGSRFRTSKGDCIDLTVVCILTSIPAYWSFFIIFFLAQRFKLLSELYVLGMSETSSLTDLITSILQRVGDDIDRKHMPQILVLDYWLNLVPFSISVTIFTRPFRIPKFNLFFVLSRCHSTV